MPTDPWNLPLYTDVTAATPVENLFNGISNGLNDALTDAVGGVADLNALATLDPADFPGRLVSVAEGGALYRSNGTAWVQNTTPRFSSASARNSAYAKASGAYLVTGVESRVTSDLWPRFYDGSTWRPLNVSEQPVLPSSVSGTGVSLNTATGLITLSGATSIIVNGCFTADFSRYRIRGIMQYSAGNTTVTMNLRAGGTNSTASVYDKTEFLARNGGLTTATSTAETSWGMGTGTTTRLIDMMLYEPSTASATFGQMNSVGITNPMAQNNNNAVMGTSFLHRTSAAYDGFAMTPAASCNGVIRIFGLL